MIPYAHLSNVKEGELYRVIYAHYSPDQKGWLHIPIIPDLHADPDISSIVSLHYHVDCRFPMSKVAKKQFVVKGGRTMRILQYEPQGIYSKNIDYMTIRTVKAVSSFTGIELPPYAVYNPFEWSVDKIRYWDWAGEYIGKEVRKDKCPHRGTQMIDRGDGYMECPLHGLVCSKKSKQICVHPDLNRREVEKYELAVN